MTGSERREPLVALAGRFDDAELAGLIERRPAVRFVRLGTHESAPSEAAWREAADAEILFTRGQPRDAFAATVDRLPALRWVHTASSGVDRFLIPAVTEGRIRLTRTAHARAEPIAEHVVALALALTKQLPALFAAQRDHRWWRPTAGTLVGAQVGIVGAGAVGRAAARRFRALGARTVGSKRRPEPLPEFDAVHGSGELPRLLRDSDVVVLACPLTSDTRHLLGREELALMKRGAYLINVARGAVVVEPALVAALRQRRLAGAALDVFEQEPLPEESPLWDLSNVIVSPHCAAAVPAVWDAVVDEFLDNLHRWLVSRPLAHVVVAADAAY